jgi:hypothetical protein
VDAKPCNYHGWLVDRGAKRSERPGQAMKSVESMVVLLKLAVVFVLGVAQSEARISCITDSIFKVSAFFSTRSATFPTSVLAIFPCSCLSC